MRRIDGGFAMMPQTVYASQKYDQTGRRRLQACKLHLDLGGLPDISEPMPFQAQMEAPQTPSTHL